jgi:hypothetical protein
MVAYCAHVINFGGAGEPATTCHFGLHAMIAREAAITSLRNWRSTATILISNAGAMIPMESSAPVASLSESPSLPRAD